MVFRNICFREIRIDYSRAAHIGPRFMLELCARPYGLPVDEIAIRAVIGTMRELRYDFKFPGFARNERNIDLCPGPSA